MILSKIAKLINAEIIGDENLSIQGVSSFENPKTNFITLITSNKHLSDNVLESKTVLLVNKNINQKLSSNTLLIVDDSRIAFAKITNLFLKKSISPSPSFINNSIKHKIFCCPDLVFGSNFSFGINVFIEENVSIGNNVYIGNNVTIYRNSIIGNNVTIGSGTTIGSEGFGNVLQDNKKWLHINHSGSVVIGNDVRIGENCCIDRGTIDSTEINSGVIIDNLVHIAHNVSIGEDTAIAAKVGIAGSTRIGKRNMIGGMVGIVDHIKTCDDVIISATSTVNNDLLEPGRYTGILPIIKHSSWKRVALWITKLDKIVKFIKFK